MNFSCDQAVVRTLQSVCPSVCPSVCQSHIFHNVAVIVSLWNFQELLQMTKWCPCKGSRSSVKVTEVKTQFSCLRTVLPVWIHIWCWNDAQSLMLLMRGALLFFKSIRQISMPHSYEMSILTQIGHFRTVFPYHGYAMRKILPLCRKTVTCKSKGFLYLFGHNSRIHCFWLKNLNLFSRNITFRVINYLNLVEKNH